MRTTGVGVCIQACITAVGEVDHELFAENWDFVENFDSGENLDSLHNEFWFDRIFSGAFFDDIVAENLCSMTLLVNYSPLRVAYAGSCLFE